MKCTQHSFIIHIFYKFLNYLHVPLLTCMEQMGYAKSQTCTMCSSKTKNQREDKITNGNPRRGMSKYLINKSSLCALQRVVTYETTHGVNETQTSCHQLTWRCYPQLQRSYCLKESGNGMLSLTDSPLVTSTVLKYASSTEKINPSYH